MNLLQILATASLTKSDPIYQVLETLIKKIQELENTINDLEERIEDLEP